MRAAAGVPEPCASASTAGYVHIYLYIYIYSGDVHRFWMQIKSQQSFAREAVTRQPRAAFVIWLAVLYIVRAGAVYLLDFMRTRPLGWDSLARLANRASSLRREGVCGRGRWRERRCASKPTLWRLTVFPVAAYSCVHTLCSATEVHIRFQVDR